MNSAGQSTQLFRVSTAGVSVRPVTVAHVVVVSAIWSTDNRLALWREDSAPAEAILEQLSGSAVDGLAHKATIAKLDLLLPAGKRLTKASVPVALFDVEPALRVLDLLRGKLSL